MLFEDWVVKMQNIVSVVIKKNECDKEKLHLGPVPGSSYKFTIIVDLSNVQR